MLGVDGFSTVGTLRATDVSVLSVTRHMTVVVLISFILEVINMKYFPP